VSQENVDKTIAFLEAYNRRDFDAAIEWFDPQIDWVLPPLQFADSCRGTDEVIRFWEGLDEIFEDLRLDPQETVDAGTAWRSGCASKGAARGAGWSSRPRCTTKSRRFATGS
jgi:SnoaL-like domain